MPQISKRIPIQAHAGFPSILTLPTHGMLEGNMSIIPYGESVSAAGNSKSYIRTTGDRPYMFCVSVGAATLQQSAYLSCTIYEMTAPTSPTPWSDYVQNMNRLHSNSSDLEAGSYTAEGTTKSMIYYSFLGKGFPLSTMWYEANITKYYALNIYNYDSSNACRVSFQYYIIEGIK